MSNTITFEDARQEGIILPDHYLEVTAPRSRKVIVTEKETGFEKKQKFTVEEGERHLWRLTEDFKLWGKPTKVNLTLRGHAGFEYGPDIMHRIIRELHDNPGTFEEAKSCSLPEKDYFFSSIEKAYREEKKYVHPDDRFMWYWLASRCVVFNSNNENFYVFFVNGGYVGADDLYYSGGSALSNTYAVRPEATPKSTLLLERDGCDGSMEKPWICLK